MKQSDMPRVLILEDGRTIEFFTAMNSEDIIGAIETHPAVKDWDLAKIGTPCSGSLYFNVPENNLSGATWNVESWQPLTLSPSILCRGCGNHGFIHNNKWIVA